MSRMGLWQIGGDAPTRLASADVDLESQLQDWLERDPSLLQSGLVIVGREVPNPAGRIDLLGLDRQGRWVVIELKRGAVNRATIAQAVDYASWIATAPAGDLAARVAAYFESNEQSTTLQELLEERQASSSEAEGEYREVDIIVVGTGQDPGLERMVDYLSTCGNLAVSVVAFDVFAASSGERILARVLTDGDHAATPSAAPRGGVTVEEVLERADAAGAGDVFRTVYDAATDVDLYPRAYKRSIMYAPRANRTRCLIVVWTDPTADGALRAYASPEAFHEFYGIDPARVETALLGGGDLRLEASNVEQLAEGLRSLFAGDGPP